ncbi:MAG: hypothetical protein IT186_18850 [Acidobacteria bacterium]|nr:hypothetical protein [Acidobacteriota bacterium]MCG3192273.1 hypothetical protein [Thermoanaerobaculia bacterium]MCK6682552.1 hypothetical protein [Thermoanaerobaculia bacterium]
MAGKRILLVEGQDDEHVFKHLMGRRQLGKLDEFRGKNGKHALLSILPVALKESDVASLGVVLDADTDLQGTWKAVRNGLQDSGYFNVPVEPEAGGTVILPPHDTLLPRVGVWLMPDNKTLGILEDFLRFLVPAGTPLFERVEESVNGIPQEERRFAEKDKPKAVIHTWLAWQEDPGKPLGTAITFRYLDTSVPEADVLVTWLRRLFFP